jgi:hypothetical protein
MLLVDDHQPEIVEGDGILDERMGTDDKMNRTTGELGLDLAAFLRGRRAGE